jgi:diphthamide biosynthesis enzyme Dph1/Dph2-like protein
VLEHDLGSRTQEFYLYDEYIHYDSLDNLSESKLGNFPEIDCFVVIACHNTVLIDEKQYYKLAITPFEL